MGTVRTLPAGGAAIDALGRRLDALRGDVVLAPARVVCTSPVMAVGVRRSLGRRRGGIAGVTVTTIDGLVAELARPQLRAAGLRPAGKAELAAAIRAELRSEPGRFGRVADHRTTEDRLVAFHQELTGLPGDVLDQLEVASTGLSTDALRVVRGALGRLDRVDEADDPLAALGNRTVTGGAGDPGTRPCSGDRLLDLALDGLAELAPGALGPIVLFLPEPLRPYEGRIVQALTRRSDCEVHVGLTGIGAIDDRHLRRLGAWSVQRQPEHAGPVPTAASASVLEVSDPEEEVRAALREVSAHAAAGVPLTDLAVLYAAPEPYATLLADQLDAAGLPWSGPGHRRLGLSLAGRTLRRLLALATRGLEREAVMTLLGAAPIDDGSGGEVPAALWDRLSRQAGVIDGDHWLPRLAELAGSSEGDDTKSATVELAAFVEELIERLRPPSERTWSAWAGWAVGLLERYLLLEPAGVAPTADDHGVPDPVGDGAGPWPEVERRSLDRVTELVGDLAGLDQLGLPPTLETLEATVLAELGGAVVPGRPLGQGVYIGPVASVAGLGFERIAVVGLAEGWFPRTPREDSLLPDQLRAAGAGMLIEKTAVTDVDVRAVALAAASSRRPALLLTARGDLRSNRSRTWPRMLDHLVGGRHAIDSHHQGLLDHGRPVSVEEFGLRSLIAHVENDDPVQTHELAATDTALATNLRRLANRSRSELTAHAGRVPAGRFDPTERLLSPTALETYAACPRKYLFQRVLRLGEDERPERIDEITARDRGTLMHRILERFVSDALADDDVPEPGEPWSTERRAHLFDLLDQEVKAAEARGITGGQVKTRLLRRSLYAELLHFLDTDDNLRAARGSTPFAAEYAFGFAENPALEGLWAGRRMRLRGTVDRVDLTADG
ncbi:MAG: PD-(D/E)XK nuclease family protein, partial [Actinomycetota bacterium]